MIYHFKSLVMVRKGRAFYATLYQEVFFANPGGGGSLSLFLRSIFDPFRLISKIFRLDALFLFPCRCSDFD